MIEVPIAGVKIAAPKVIAGAFFGLPLTVAIGPAFGLVALGCLGGACFGGYAAIIAAAKHNNQADGSLSLPVL